MKVIKRSKLAMLSISFMIMIAGYLNYKYDPKREENLGQTMKVDSSEVYLYTYDDNVNVYNEEHETLNKNATIYNNNSNQDSLFSYKTSRDNLISELETSLKEAMSKSTNTEETKEYEKKIEELLNKKNLLEVVEGILKAKGISDIVIVPNGEKINVIVKTKNKLTDAQETLIEEIIKEEFGTKIENINIIEE